MYWFTTIPSLSVSTILIKHLHRNTHYVPQRHTETVTDYMRWAEDAWLLFSVPVYSASSKEVERNYKKLYCIDWALAQHNSTSWDGGYSRSLENAVYIHLRRKYNRVHYFLTREKRQEVDFIAVDTRGKITLTVQVCQDISNQETLFRELEPLASAAAYYGCRQNYIVTLNQEKSFKVGEVTVNALPAWRWLLENV